MVAHRDLKPENLLLDSNLNIKIAYFGLSNVMRDGHFLRTSCGSPNYAAPEVISGNIYADPEVDVWSCGVILYALLCGSLPFDDENISNLFKNIKGGTYTLASHLSAGAKDLIPQMLLVDPLKRITISEIKQYPWFQFRIPGYLTVPPLDSRQQAKKVDEVVLNEVVNLGFDKNQLVSSLQNRIQNNVTESMIAVAATRKLNSWSPAFQATVTYYLIFDKRYHASNGRLVDNLLEAETDGSLVTSMHGNGSIGIKMPKLQDERE